MDCPDHNSVTSGTHLPGLTLGGGDAMSIVKFRREVERLVQRIVGDVFPDCTFTMEVNKHIKVRLFAGPHRRTVVIGSTISEWRGMRNNEALLKRMLRELQALAP